MKTIRFIISVLLLAGCAGEKTETPVTQDEPQSVVKILRELHKDRLTDWDKLQLAIIMVESKGNPDAVGSLDDLGLYQMRKVYVDEVNRVCGTDYKHEDAFDPDKAIEIFNAMQGHYNPGKDLDTALRYHNKGKAYKRQILQSLELVNRYESVRQKLIEYGE